MERHLLTLRLSGGGVQSAPNEIKMITCVAELDCARICGACAVCPGRAPVDRPAAAARLRYLPDSAVHAQIDLQLLGQNSQLSLSCVLLALRHAAEVVGEAAPVPRPAAAAPTKQLCAITRYFYKSAPPYGGVSYSVAVAGRLPVAQQRGWGGGACVRCNAPQDLFCCGSTWNGMAPGMPT